MDRLITRHTYIFYTIVFILHILNVFLKNDVLQYGIGLLTLPMLYISFIRATRLFKILGSIFMIVGMGLFVYSGSAFYEIPLNMTSTLPLLAFLTVLPWMNSAVRAGRYDRRINQLMKANSQTLDKFYMRSSLTTYILTIFVNLSALSLSQTVLIENMKRVPKKLRDSFISRTTLRAFALAVAWSPMEIMVAITVDATGISYLTYLPWLFLCSVIVFSLDLFWGKRTFQGIEYQSSIKTKTRILAPRQIGMQILKLLVALAIFLMSVVTISNQFDLNFTLTVTLVILPFTIAWSILMKRWRSFLAIGWATWKMRTNGLQNFVVLFLTLAFFTSSLNGTTFLDPIQQPFLAATDNPILILLLIQFTYLGMSMIGVHPVATIAVLAEVLLPLYGIVNPLSIGIVLITGALATAAVGTYGVTVTMTSMNTQQNPYRITLRNMPFALLYGGVGTTLAFLLL